MSKQMRVGAKQNLRFHLKGYFPFFILFSIFFAIFVSFTFFQKNDLSKIEYISPHYTLDGSKHNITSEEMEIAETTEANESGDTLGISTVNTKKWGVYTGWDIADIQNFEKTTGETINYISSFVHWGNESEFPIELANYAKKNKKTLVIFWEVMDYRDPMDSNKRFTYDTIIAGKWNKYIRSFRESAKAYKSEVILIPFEEMNGDWYSWSGTFKGNTPKKHIQAFRHIKSIFITAPNVKFAWTVNSRSYPTTSANAISKYYPGDKYVDYIGINGFNFGNPWVSFDQIFKDGLNEVEKFKKPIIITSMASAQGSKKAAWLSDAVSKISARKSIIGWIWFNENKERNWTLWSDNNTLTTLRKLIK